MIARGPREETVKQAELIDVERLDEAQIRDLQVLFQNEWWTRGRTLDETRRLVEHTDLVLGICERDTGHLAAFARVLTDRTFRAFVYDVIVDPRYRGAGLGTRLMRRILDHEVLARVPQIDLNCRPVLQPFYRRLGFRDDIDGTVLMRWTRQG